MVRADPKNLSLTRIFFTRLALSKVGYDYEGVKTGQKRLELREMNLMTEFTLRP